MLDACRDSADRSGRTGGIDGSTINELSNKMALFFAAKEWTSLLRVKTVRAWDLYALSTRRPSKGKAADSNDEITFLGLASYVSMKVERDSPGLLEVSAADAQRPNLMGNLSGTIVLGKGKADRGSPLSLVESMAGTDKEVGREKTEADSPNKTSVANPIQKLPYEQALGNVLRRLDLSGNGVSIGSSLLSPSELDELAGQLISGVGAATSIAGMPRDFTRRRVAQMMDSNLVVPYINHEGIAYRPYSIQTKSAANQLDDAASRSGLKVIGITPLDHSRALYAVAVSNAAGNQLWMLARVTEQYARSAQNGNGPEPSKVHSAVTKAFGMLQK
jgi:hypothetical protein